MSPPPRLDELIAKLASASADHGVEGDGPAAAVAAILREGADGPELFFIRRAERADDIFGSILAGGITASVALGSFLHFAVVTRLLPATGITLPLISWGGTSIVFTLIELAAAARISAEARR